METEIWRHQDYETWRSQEAEWATVCPPMNLDDKITFGDFRGLPNEILVVGRVERSQGLCAPPVSVPCTAKMGGGAL